LIHGEKVSNDSKLYEFLYTIILDHIDQVNEVDHP